MIPTKIRREVLKQVVMARLNYLAKQLATPTEVFVLGRQCGRRISQIRFELLMLEIQLAHQQLDNLMQERLPYFQSMQATNYQDVVNQQQGMKHHER